MNRFSLRDVFWLTLVVAMGLGWWTDHWFHWRIEQMQYRAHGMKWILEQEGWIVTEQGWNVSVQKAGDKFPGYEVGAEESR